MHRGLLLGVMALVVANCAAAGSEPLPRWGIGWLGQSEAPTFRVRLGEWQVGLAARPNDDLVYRETWDGTSYEWSTPDSTRNVPDDDKTESGWVRLDIARNLKTWNRVDLPLMLAFAYSWSDEKREDRRWETGQQGYYVTNSTTYRNTYEQGHGKSFSSHGWSGTSGIGLLSLVFYL